MKFLLLLLISLITVHISNGQVDGGEGGEEGSVLSTTYYVDNTSDSTAQDGLDWSTAFSDLNDALDLCEEDDSIYIAEGIYKPTTTSNREKSFTIPSYCDLYGGFNGESTERQPSDRPNPLKKTILDGNIAVEGIKSDNSYHVVILEGDNILDGLVIRNGYAVNDNDPSDYYSNSGGGILITSDSTTFELNDVTFEDNTATQGGGLYVFGSTNKGIVISNCTFTSNTAKNSDYRGGYGGAVFLSYNADTKFIDCDFTKNNAILRGGALYADYASDSTIINSRFAENIASSGHGGAIFVEDRNSQFGSTTLTLKNTVIKDNSAIGYGGGIMMFNGVTGNFSSVQIKNNTATLYGGVGSFASTWDFDTRCTSCLFAQNKATGNISLSNYGYDEFDPYSNITYDEYSETQYLQELWDNSQNEEITLSEKASSSIIIYVNENTPAPQAGQDGTSWNSAYSDLQDAINDANTNGYGDTAEIWVAKGQYSPSEVPSWSTSSTIKDKSFILYEYTTIYGGFDGTETSRNQRNWNLNPTYFWSEVGSGNNKAQQIVIGAHNCRIDGMIFKRGYGDANIIIRRRMKENRRNLISTSLQEVIDETSRIRGGALFVNSSDINIVNSLFIENFAFKGGAVYCMGYHSSEEWRYPRFYNVAFINNGASLRGGAIAGDAYCNFYCEQCNIVGNVGEKGGSVYVDFTSSPTFIQTTWTNNTAIESGGAVGIDGGGTLTVSDSEATYNKAIWEGGAFYSGSFNPFDADEEQNVVATNVTLGNNICEYCHSNYFLWGSAGLYFGPTPEPSPAPTTTPEPTTDDESQDNVSRKKVSLLTLSIGFVFLIIFWK